MANEIGRVGWRSYVSPLPSPLWNGMLAYYTADDTANDVKGTYNGTLVNGATYGAGKIGSAFSFDGVNDYMSTATNSLIDSSLEHTYSCWVKPASNSIGVFIGNGTSMLGVRAGRSLTFFQYYVNAEVNSGYILPLNTWTHVAVTYKGNSFGANNVLFYVNGSLVYTGTLSMPAGGSKIYLGSNNAGSGGFYNGLLDEAGVWNRALTAAEVTELYGSGAGKQYTVPAYPALWNNLKAYFTADNTASDSSVVYTGTLTNGTTYATGKIGNGFQFDGVDDYIGFTSKWFRKSKSEPFTFSYWAYISSAGAISVFSNGADDGHWAFVMSQRIYFQIGASSGSYLRVYSTSTIPLNTFKHITITYDGSASTSGFKIYINGVSDTVLNAQNNLGTFDTPISSSALIPAIGRRPVGNAYYFSGKIDELGIWDRALTAAEALDLYNAGAGKQYPN